MLKVAVLISGRGSNLQALIDACQDSEFPAQIVRVVANRPAAEGLARAAQAGIASTVIENQRDRECFDTALDNDLRDHGIDLVCLAGFMRILTPGFVAAWRDRLINIHPSLLPAFKGLNAQRAALDAGVKIAGCTVHYVRARMDSGPIIAQAAVPVLEDDDEESLSARILVQEHIIYPRALRLIAQGRVRVDGGRTAIDGAAPAKRR